MEKQLAASVPLAVLNDKLKEKDAAHALAVADFQAAAKVSEERRLEAARLAEEVKQLQEAEERRLGEVETLRKNGEDLRRKLKEAVDAHDQTVQVTKERELEQEQLVRGLVSEAERVNGLILGTGHPPLDLSFSTFLSDLIGLMRRLLS